MQTSSFYSFIKQENEKTREKSLSRTLSSIDSRDGKHITIGGKPYINFSSNDYLGLASDRHLMENFLKLFSSDPEKSSYGLSSSSSRLLTGNSSMHDKLETLLATYFARENALILSSGYHANSGLISSLVGRGDIIFSDRLNHASIVDGALLSRAEFCRYRHLDYNHLEELLEKKRGAFRNAIIISESLFSMDGDIADLKKLVALKKKFDSALYVDEAHAIGVFGSKGCGICEEQNITSDIDIVVGTFGKALASYGAFAIVDSVVKEYLINKVRPLIFTTALPPIVLNWNMNILGMLPYLSEKRAVLRKTSHLFKKQISAIGIETNSQSQIIPVIVGKNKTAQKLAQALQQQGFLVKAIRPPTVPEGTARVRFSLTTDISENDILDAVQVLKKSLYEI